MNSCKTPAGNARLHFETAGSGDAVLFAHEFAGDMTSWRGQVAALSNRRRCIVYNARGYPPSDVPENAAQYSQRLAAADIARVLDASSTAWGHIVGLSMGSMAALHFAFACPTRTRSLVLVGCGPGAQSDSRQRFQSAIEAFALQIERDGLEAAAAEYARSPARIELRRKNAEAWQRFEEGFASHSRLGALMTLRHIIAPRPWLADLAGDLERVAVPVLIMTGDSDESCLDSSLFLKRAIPGARLAVLPGAGHALNLEEPILFNDILHRFLDEVERGDQVTSSESVAGPAREASKFAY